ncbi:Cytosolic Fe-S cluster assembly factor CFD1 protein [Rutstroemia sp. NJR-2017a BBW]|nr:Cytosolic Fe-S cluster assembly factor CFD1 protein [Rutstroemia sp. NJR-2017a BBW]
MTGKFTVKDPARCAHYARFMAKLTVTEANIIYWSLFLFVLALMCTASIQHQKSNALTEIEKSLPPAEASSVRHRRRNRRLRVHYLSIASLCFIFALISVIFEVFAAFQIQYCDGEDLMQLYWGFWSILQVGSLIAILGVMLQFWIVLGNVTTPSWAVALGTPVLVFAALGWIFRHLTKKGRERLREMYDPEEEDTDVEAQNEKVGSGKNFLERLMSWTPRRQTASDKFERMLTARSANTSDLAFSSRVTTIAPPVPQPGDIRRSLTL